MLIGVVQLVLATIFALAPAPFSALLGLPAAPEWVHWLFAMFSARAFGFGYGMFLAAREPERHRHWLLAMVGVQAIDWVATLFYLMRGAVSLAQVSTAAFLPVIFVGVLVLCYPRQRRAELRAAGDMAAG